MQEFRREFLRMAGLGVAGGAAALIPSQAAAQKAEVWTGGPAGYSPVFHNVRAFGAKGDGSTIDTPAINRAVEAASIGDGGGTVLFPAGTYACYTIRLKSNVTLLLEAGATILAASVPDEGTTNGGYAPAGPPQPWEQYQDYGHNHWANSLLYGENLENVAIVGQGLIWGKGLSRGWKSERPLAESPGVGNKAIALKNCRNVTIAGLRMLKCGHFAILLTGVDNVVIDGLTVDTNRDGMDIDCCRNVRVSNCAVNSPWDDAICPKSSFALGYARPTENLTIINCYVTGAYELGTMLSGEWKDGNVRGGGQGRIKFGTESNGGFLNTTVSNCVFDRCRGLAIESVDGARIEDMTITNLAMRGVTQSPLFLRLGERLRGPGQVVPGVIRRVLISNVTSSDAVAELPSIIAGLPQHLVEDIKISDVFLHQRGGQGAELATRIPPENEKAYPEPDMFGPLPATGFFIRHARNVEFSNIEVATGASDARPAFYLEDVEGADFFRLRFPERKRSGQFRLRGVKDFRVFGCQHYTDVGMEQSDDKLV